MTLGPYAGFIIGAYGVAAVVFAALIAWIIIDHRTQTRTLEDLERQGITRRARQPEAS